MNYDWIFRTILNLDSNPSMPNSTLYFRILYVSFQLCWPVQEWYLAWPDSKINLEIFHFYRPSYGDINFKLDFFRRLLERTYITSRVKVYYFPCIKFYYLSLNYFEILNDNEFDFKYISMQATTSKRQPPQFLRLTL